LNHAKACLINWLPHPPLDNGRSFVGAIAVWVAWRTKNVWLTIAVGMAVLLLLQMMG
jgi:branched-subunit amino acid transport protein